MKVKRILGKGSLDHGIHITYQERPSHTVSIMGFRDGKLVHETQYFGDHFEVPAWRRHWVRQMP